MNSQCSAANEQRLPKSNSILFKDFVRAKSVIVWPTKKENRTLEMEISRIRQIMPLMRMVKLMNNSTTTLISTNTRQTYLIRVTWQAKSKFIRLSRASKKPNNSLKHMWRPKCRN